MCLILVPDVIVTRSELQKLYMALAFSIEILHLSYRFVTEH